MSALTKNHLGKDMTAEEIVRTLSVMLGWGSAAPWHVLERDLAAKLGLLKSLSREEHLATVRRQLIMRWQEGGRVLSYADHPFIMKEAAQLMHERGFPGLTIRLIPKPGSFMNLFELEIVD